MTARGTTRFGNRDFRWGEKTYLMGIINLSPESFSGDGLSSLDDALDQARRFAAAGADILDVGGESTRPNQAPVSEAEELDRVIPVIERLAKEVDLPLSVDTTKPGVARQALASGAAALNDQWGLKHGAELAALAAAAKVPLILMSNQRDQSRYDASIGRDTADYDDVIAVVTSSLRQSLETALASGVAAENIILDPGIGFGKTWQQDLEIIRRLDELKTLGQPLLSGPSRKSCIGMALDLPASQRLEGTAAAVSLSIAGGADMVRVHDVAAMDRVRRMCDAILRS